MGLHRAVEDAEADSVLWREFSKTGGSRGG
jgi:hypothetical protein